MYTGWHKNKIENDDDIYPHVDHIVECQLGEFIWNNALDGRRTLRSRSVMYEDRSTPSSSSVYCGLSSQPVG